MNRAIDYMAKLSLTNANIELIFWNSAPRGIGRVLQEDARGIL